MQSGYEASGCENWCGFAVSHGPGKVAEGLALGRFREFAGRTGTVEAAGLAGETEKAFSGLLRNPRKTDASEPKAEAVILQETLNGLNKGENLLKLDGDIGPKTTDAFNRLNRTIGSDHVVGALGRYLGILS